uniref:Uncharacterized protein n=1 Tax=Arundo donax TaxID=35708 RepID=A0A0A8ZJX8_ARUDO
MGSSGTPRSPPTGSRSSSRNEHEQSTMLDWGNARLVYMDDFIVRTIL